MKPLQAFLLAVLSMHAQAQSEVPSDVARYVEKRDLCDHFRSEEPYDSQRRRFLQEKVHEHCTDKQLEALKVKYKDQPAILARLKDYELRIEGSKK